MAFEVLGSSFHGTPIKKWSWRRAMKQSGNALCQTADAADYLQGSRVPANERRNQWAISNLRARRDMKRPLYIVARSLSRKVTRKILYGNCGDDVKRSAVHRS